MAVDISGRLTTLSQADFTLIKKCEVLVWGWGMFLIRLSITIPHGFRVGFDGRVHCIQSCISFNSNTTGAH